MEYRELPCNGEKISVIGMGAAGMHYSSTEEVEATVRAAIDAGVNLFDFIPSNTKPFEGYRRALLGQRDKVKLQVHIGAEYTSGNYGWTTDASLAIREFEARLDLLDTHYADFGFIHCIDEPADLDEVLAGGIFDYAVRMKDEGVIRHLAFSTHTTGIARRLLETGLFDFAMFSINPMYDYTDESDYGRGEADERMELYRMFEQHKVGVSVMKTFAGGQLLDAGLSPFGRALTRTQCIQYALDKPGVVSVLPGVRNMADLRDVLAYLDASAAERDYSVLGAMSPKARGGSCVYCNHCQPCPVEIPIGLANKYYDLARQGDALAREHYLTLEHTASECIECGHCDSRCPFGVHQSDRMQEISAYFGK